MNGKRRVVIVGAGVAGLACAIAAARAGAAVQVFDAAESGGHIAAHIDVVPNLLRDLSVLGIADQFQRKGFTYSRLSIADVQGRLLAELPLQRLAGADRPPALGISCRDFLDTLEQASIEIGVSVERSARVTDVDPEMGILTLANGQKVSGDLVLLATGGASTLAPMQGKAASPTSVEQEWIYALTARVPGLDNPTWLMHHSGAKAIKVPISMREMGVALTAFRQTCATTESPQAIWQKQLALFPALGRALPALQGTQELCVRPVRIEVMKKWHQGRLLCVGDAAHMLAPHFGQAAAQSVEDAVVLSELLEKHLDVPTLIERFCQRRIPRAQRIAELLGRAVRWDVKPEAKTNLIALAEELSVFTAEPA